MASPLILRSPQCISCIRRSTLSFGERKLFPSGQQIRGKKKNARKANKVNALLLSDVKGYGNEGTVIAIASGLMRNEWFPARMAEYATEAKLQELGIKEEDVIDLDKKSSGSKIIFTERELKKQRKAEAKANMLAKEERRPKGAKKRGVKKVPKAIEAPVERLAPIDLEPIKLELDLLSAAEATVILDNVLPPHLEFYREAIEPVPAPKKLSPSLQSKAVISAAAKGPEITANNSIYGSVSTADIVASMTEILAEDRLGKKVVLAAEDVSFVEREVGDAGEVGGDRVKMLGVFEVEIRLKGAPDLVKRTIKVSAQA